MCKACEQVKEGEHLYEDEKTVVVFPEYPLTAGHLVVLSKDHFVNVENVPKDLVTHFFYVASFAASVLFEGMGAQGTNIIMNDGSVGRHGHFAIEIIPRKENDGIEFKYDPKKLPEADMEDAKSRISWEFTPEEPSHIKTVTQEEIDKAEDDEAKKRHDQLIKWYQKIP